MCGHANRYSCLFAANGAETQVSQVGQTHYDLMNMPDNHS